MQMCWSIFIICQVCHAIKFLQIKFTSGVSTVYITPDRSTSLMAPAVCHCCSGCCLDGVFFAVGVAIIGVAPIMPPRRADFSVELFSADIH